MKKTLIIALASMMMFAFTQCGGKGNEKENGTETTNQTETTNEKVEKEVPVVNGTKQFSDLMNAYDEIGKMLKKATTCEELEEMAMALVVSNLTMELGSENYTAEDRMTEKEQTKLKDIANKILKEAEKKTEELGCEKKEYSL